MMDTLSLVAAKHGLSIADLRGRSQRHHIARARREAAMGLRQKGLSLRAIGRILARDHTSIDALIRRTVTFG
jgi:chromosomal replication initiation ATPase DnaA